MLRQRAVHFLLWQIHLVIRVGHGLDQLPALDLELRVADRLAPRPFDPDAEHLGDVGLAPGLDYVAGDVVALRVFGREDIVPNFCLSAPIEWVAGKRKAP